MLFILRGVGCAGILLSWLKYVFQHHSIMEMFTDSQVDRLGFRVTDVRAVPGDSAFLIDDGKTSILCDSGFAFTGDAVAENIRKALGDRKLDFILLTHSHYDHVLGVTYIVSHYPEVKVVAGSYAAEIFRRPSALKRMMDLDRKYAAESGIMDYEDRTDDLRVDIVVDDGDKVKCGDMEFTVVGLPGHTKCSIGFYLESKHMLIGTETLGVYFGDGHCMPAYLVGYDMTMKSFDRIRTFTIDSMLVPHYGFVDGDEARDVLDKNEGVSRSVAKTILKMLRDGSSDEDIIEWYKREYYVGSVPSVYPIAAFNLNTGLMIDLIRKELLSSIETII